MPESEPDRDLAYEHLATLAEHLATELAMAKPDFAALARDAYELAAGLQICGEEQR